MARSVVLRRAAFRRVWFVSVVTSRRFGGAGVDVYITARCLGREPFEVKPLWGMV